MSVVSLRNRKYTAFPTVNRAAGIHVPPSGDLPRNEAAGLDHDFIAFDFAADLPHRPSGSCFGERSCARANEPVTGLRRPVRLHANAQHGDSGENGENEYEPHDVGHVLTCCTRVEVPHTHVGRGECLRRPIRHDRIPNTVNATPAATLADASSSSMILTLVIVLSALGIVMLLVTMWLVRSTSPERALLARLELMGTRRWRKATVQAKQQDLEAATVPRSKDATPSGRERHRPGRWPGEPRQARSRRGRPDPRDGPPRTASPAATDAADELEAVIASRTSRSLSVPRVTRHHLQHPTGETMATRQRRPTPRIRSIAQTPPADSTARASTLSARRPTTAPSATPTNRSRWTSPARARRRVRAGRRARAGAGRRARAGRRQRGERQ